jgi:CRP-like cAMP-binding protein
MGTSVLTGSLDFLALGDLIQVIGPNGGTGVLRIISKYAPEPGLLYFVKGNIINAKAGEKSGLQAAYALFGWLEGEFEFVEEEVTVPRLINENRMAIILDGNRMLDDGQIQKLGPLSFEEQMAAAADSATHYDKPISHPVIKGPLVDYMYVVSEDEFSEGQTIVEEKTHGSWNWTVLEGLVDVVKETNLGPIKLYRMGDGAFLGSLDSLSFKGSPRNATAVAASDVQLGVLDTQRLTSEYAGLSQPFRKLLRSLENRLREVTENVIRVQQKKNHAKELLKETKLVIRQSSSELRNCFTITEGRAYVVQHSDFGHLLLAELGPGDFIGKIPFLDIGHEPLNASVFAASNFKVNKPDLDRLKEEFEGLSGMFRGLIENVSTSVMVATRLAYDFQRQNAARKNEKPSTSKRK